MKIMGQTQLFDNLLKIGCWNHEIPVSRGTPNFQSHSDQSCFLDSPSWTTSSPCTTHRKKPWATDLLLTCNFWNTLKCEMEIFRAGFWLRLEWINKWYNSQLLHNGDSYGCDLLACDSIVVYPEDKGGVSLKHW